MDGPNPEPVGQREKHALGNEHESNGSENEFYVDPVKEVKLLAKLDLAFTPVIMLVYLSCFLDRSNIGNCSRLLNYES